MDFRLILIIFFLFLVNWFIKLWLVKYNDVYKLLLGCFVVLVFGVCIGCNKFLFL